MREPEYQFVPTHPEELLAELTVSWETFSGRSVHPASPERLLLQWFASVLLQERALLNRAANRNIPSRAEGEDLDALAELFFARKRSPGRSATCTVRFYISAPQTFAVRIPAGTRVTDPDQTLYWQTGAEAWIQAGETYADVAVTCQSAGSAGNGWTEGLLDTAVDIYDYYAGCENVTESGGGADPMTDGELYEAMRLSMDALSTAGARGSYIYHAKAASTEIADVAVYSPSPGEVRICALMKDGRPAGEETKAVILEACGAEDVRPLTDHVEMEDPETVEYRVKLTWYLPAGETDAAAVREAVTDAVEEYVRWQGGKLGRDINPSRLIGMVMAAGVKRVEVAEPAFTRLRDAGSAQRPQVASLLEATVTEGGAEDE